MWIVFSPDNSDLEAVNVPLGNNLVTFTNGVPRQVPDAIGASLLASNPELYKPASAPAQQAQPASKTSAPAPAADAAPVTPTP